MPESRITLRISMLSDWHVGTGAGRPGSVDRLVSRDEDGLPYVPAKSLTGVWRDACERVATGLDGGQAGTWSEWVDVLFGDQPSLPQDAAGDASRDVSRPRPAALSVRPARMPAALVKLLRPASTATPAADRARRILADSLTFVKPGVKIDGRSGRAEDEHLRFVEMGRVKSSLETHATLLLPKDCLQPAITLLVAGAILVERIGGKRRRGSGRCRLELAGADVPSVEQALAWLSKHEPPAVPSGIAEDAVTAPAVAPAGGDDWIAVSYRLQLATAAVVASQTVGNVVESLDHVPGTLLLPHVTRALQQLGIDVRPAVARGDLRVLPATPSIAGSPGRPVPLSVHQPKVSSAVDSGAVNVLVESAKPVTVQLRPVRQGFVGPRIDATAGHATTRRTVRTHNVVEDKSQRPNESVGGVYTYEAIAPTVLMGRMLVRAGLWQRITAAPRWRETLDGPCRIGRSKKDDYGQATFEIAGDAAAPAAPTLAGRKLTVWLLSDVLLRDERLRPDPTVGALRRALVAAIDPDGSRHIDLVAAPRGFVRVRRTESWQQSWGLPRPSLVGLQAGSCLEFEVRGEISVADLSRLEAAGIGDRTGEGYGQVSFNDPLVTEKNTVLTTADVSVDAGLPSAQIDRQNGAYDFACTIEEQAWRGLLRRAALDAGSRYQDLFDWETKGRNPKPTMSQIGGLRSLLAAITDDAGVQRAIRWLDHLASNKKRCESWPKGKQGVERIRVLLTDRAAVWRHLSTGGNGPDAWPTLTAGAAERLRKQLWPTAVRSLLQAAIRACKRSRDRQAIAERNGER